MDRERHLLPVLATITGLAWMAAVLLIAANQKGIDLTGDLAYDRANRVHTLALTFLLATTLVVYRTIRDGDLAGRRAAGLGVLAAALMLVGNVVSFWGALLTDGASEQFWGGWAGWLTFLPGLVLFLGASIGLARAARRWPDTSRAQRWSIWLAALLLAITTDTWAISPAVTLAPALLAAFALLSMGTAVARAAGDGTSGRTAQPEPAPAPQTAG
jgi:hypothetical protein